jgi:hypothetical protein
MQSLEKTHNTTKIHLHGEKMQTISLDSDESDSDVADNISTISESFKKIGGTRVNSTAGKHYISGYLLKQNQDNSWQKRYFETNGTFLTYYKSKKMTTLLAALNIQNILEIARVRIFEQSSPF